MLNQKCVFEMGTKMKSTGDGRVRIGSIDRAVKKPKLDKIKGISFGTLLAGKVADGSKSVTRRLVKLHPGIEQMVTLSNPSFSKSGHLLFFDCEQKDGTKILARSLDVPYRVGQLLYVREPWRVASIYNKPNGSAHIPDGADIEYLAERVKGYALKSEWFCFSDAAAGRQRLARFMPRRFARTFLRVTEVSCERLLEISHAHAIREGIELVKNPIGRVGFDDEYIWKVGEKLVNGSREAFFSLWDSINGKDAHLQNPWVWVIEFQKLEMPNPWNESLPWKPTWTKCDGEWIYGNCDHVLGCDFAITVKYDRLSTAWDYSVSICGKETDSGYGLTDDEAKENAIKDYRKSSKGIAPHLL